MNTLLLLLALCISQSDQLRDAATLSQQKDYEASDKILKSIKDKSSLQYGYLRMINSYALNDKEGVVFWADSILYYFGHEVIPNRYYDMAFILKAEAETWNEDKYSLEDIARDMAKVENRLDNAKGGNETQKIQKDITDRLQKLIDKLEEEKKNKSVEQKQDKSNKQSKPLEDSVENHPDGPGLVVQKKIKNLADVWGKLPEKERAKALVELTRLLPAKDRAMIESYFKAVQERAKKLVR